MVIVLPPGYRILASVFGSGRVIFLYWAFQKPLFVLKLQFLLFSYHVSWAFLYFSINLISTENVRHVISFVNKYDWFSWGCRRPAGEWLPARLWPFVAGRGGAATGNHCPKGCSSRSGGRKWDGGQLCPPPWAWTHQPKTVIARVQNVQPMRLSDTTMNF